MGARKGICERACITLTFLEIFTDGTHTCGQEDTCSGVQMIDTAPEIGHKTMENQPWHSASSHLSLLLLPSSSPECSEIRQCLLCGSQPIR